MDFVRTLLSVDLKYVGTPSSLWGCCLSVVGAFMFVWSGHSWGKLKKSGRVLKNQTYETGTKGVTLKVDLLIFTFFVLVHLIYPQINTLDTKLSARIPSGYWICQFYLNPFELLRNEFKSRVDRQDGSFKNSLTGSLWFKSILFKSSKVGQRLKSSVLEMKSSSKQTLNLSV